MTRIILVITIAIAISCNNSSTSSDYPDTATSSSPIDSMPVVKPPITDSSAIIMTPPTHDDNVIHPDSIKRR